MLIWSRDSKDVPSIYAQKKLLFFYQKCFYSWKSTSFRALKLLTFFSHSLGVSTAIFVIFCFCAILGVMKTQLVSLVAIMEMMLMGKSSSIHQSLKLIFKTYHEPITTTIKHKGVLWNFLDHWLYLDRSPPSTHFHFWLYFLGDVWFPQRVELTETSPDIESQVGKHWHFSAVDQVQRHVWRQLVICW